MDSFVLEHSAGIRPVFFFGTCRNQEITDAAISHRKWGRDD